MAISFRPAVAADLPSIHEVYNEALNDMIRREGGRPPETPDTTCYVFPQRAYPDLFFVAEERGRAVAFANALLSDGIWFLSGFWCRPSHQGKGIARPALELCWEAGRRAGAHTFCVFSSSDPPAMGNYMRMGMMPGAPFVSLALAPEQARAADIAPAPVVAAPAGESTVAALGAVDAIVRGARRPAEHRFWLEDVERACLTLVDRAQVVAYAYVHRPTGRIGPVAWLHRRGGNAPSRRSAAPSAPPARITTPSGTCSPAVFGSRATGIS